MHKLDIQSAQQVTQYLQEKNEGIKKIEKLCMEAEAQLTVMRKEYIKSLNELKAAGINSVAELETKLLADEQDLLKKLDELELLIPNNLIDKFKDLSVDQILNREEMEGIDESVEF